MRYKVIARCDKADKNSIINVTRLMDSLETDSWSEVEEFILENCQKGYNCEFMDNENSFNGGIAYAVLFKEYTTEAEDLIIREYGWRI